jgi:hypothetical protein
VQTPKKSVWRLIKKLKIDLLFDPVYHALKLCIEVQISIQERHLHTHMHGNTIQNNRVELWNQPGAQRPIN